MYDVGRNTRYSLPPLETNLAMSSQSSFNALSSLELQEFSNDDDDDKSGSPLGLWTSSA